jgi:hypothetical protein
MSEYYSNSADPADNSDLTSSVIRAEHAAIEAGTDKLPTLAGNGGKIVAINSGGTAQEAITTTGTGSGVRATSPTLTTPNIGTPSAGVLTNCTGTAAGLTAGNVTTNANLTGPITSTGNATAVAAQTGTGSTFVMQASPTLTTPNIGTPSAGVLTNCTGTAAGLTAGNVTTNANLTGHVTSVGNAAVLGSFTLAQLNTAISDADVLPLVGGTLTGALALTGLASNLTVGGASIPQNSQSAAYVTVAADANKHILHPTADNNPRTFTIDSNANVAYAVGTAITFVNEINTLTIAITSDTLVLAGAGTTGSRTLAAMGIATALKKTSTSWIISGVGLT